MENSPDGNPEYYILMSSQIMWEYQDKDDGKSVQEESDGNGPKRKWTIWHEVHMKKNPDADIWCSEQLCASELFTCYIIKIHS